MSYSSHNGNDNGNDNSFPSQYQNVFASASNLKPKDIAYISSLYQKSNSEFTALLPDNQQCLDMMYRVYLALRYKDYLQWKYYQNLCYHIQASTVKIDTAQLASTQLYKGLKNPKNKTCTSVEDFYNNFIDGEQAFKNYIVNLLNRFDRAAIHRAQGSNKRKNNIDGKFVPSTHSSTMFSNGKKKGRKRKSEKASAEEKEPKKPRIAGESYMNIVT